MGTFGIPVAIALLVLSSLYQIHGEQLNKSPSGKRVCDVYRGQWVFDDSYPLYNSTDCPFIEQVFNCQENGRPDNLYLKYRWQPTKCNLPRFNGRDFLRRQRGKRIMFVGDSLSLNQWQSLTCMLHRSVPHAHYKLARRGGLSTFSFSAYNVTLMMNRNTFLVDIVKEKSGRILKLNSINSGKQWKGIDTLIFNTWHWWLHTGRKQPWDFIQDANKTYKDMDRLIAFEKGLRTWARWVDYNVNPNQTKVFFQGVSPDHSNSSDWGGRDRKDCRGEQKPVGHQRNYRGGPHPAEAVVEKVLSKMSSRVYLIKTTKLSQLRKDGHPSIYGFGGHRASDCSHWCLAGVPDTWNQFLYAALIPTT